MTYIKTKLKREIEIDSIITLHYFEYMRDFVFTGESHDFWEFLYVDKGTVSVCANDTWRQLTAGDIIFHKPNEFHAIKSIGKNSPNLVVMSFTTNSPAMNFFNGKFFRLTAKERSLISLIISEGESTFSTPMHIPSIEQVHIKAVTPFASQQLIILYLELLLITAVRSHTSDTAENITIHKGYPDKRAAKSGLVDNIFDYLEFHICEQLKITDICSDFSISRSALEACFNRQVGCGVISYFNRMKIQRAKDIIRDGTMNLTEIAYFLSYSSLPYFSKQFKAATGMSPSAYSSSIKGMTEALKREKEGVL